MAMDRGGDFLPAVNSDSNSIFRHLPIFPKNERPTLKILLVAATPLETRTLREEWGSEDPTIGKPSLLAMKGARLVLLHTGIGMVNTAYHLGRYLLGEAPDRAIQLGIAGSFPDGPELTEVVEVSQECYAELGADSPDKFLSLAEMGFENFRAPSGLYFNEIANPHSGQTGLRTCRGITVSRVHGTQAGIDRVVQEWHPEVESMEGAAFFQACLLAGIPFLQLRGISNRVEPRNRSAWKIPEASRAVQDFCREYLAALV